MLITLSFKKSLIVGEFQGNYLKVIPQYCIAHPYCARYLRHLRALMSARANKTYKISHKVSSIAK